MNPDTQPPDPARCILDGYNLPFDPDRHLRFVLAPSGDTSFVPPYSVPPAVAVWKERNAGWRSEEGRRTGA